jgi:hypothetical protein
MRALGWMGFCAAALVACDPADEPSGADGGSGGAMAGAGGNGTGAGAAGSGGVASRACSSYQASAPVARGDAVLGRLAWTGHDYAALWAVNERPMDVEAHWFEIHWAELDATGSVIAERTPYRTSGFDASGLPLDYGTATAMGIAPYDQGFGVLWYEEKQKRLVLALLDPSGGVNPTGPVVVADNLAADPAAIAWNGSAFAVVWAVPSARELRVATFDRTGALIGSGELANVDAYLVSLHLFGQREEFLLMFEPALPTLAEVWAARFDQGGQPVGGAALLSDPSVYASGLVVDRVGDQYAVIWLDRPKTGSTAASALRRLDGTGSLVGGPFTMDATGPWIGLAHNGDEPGAISGENDALAFQALGRDATLHGAPVEIAPRAPPLTGGGIPMPVLHAIHWNGDGFGVLWTGSAPAGWGTYYTLVRCIP